LKAFELAGQLASAGGVVAGEGRGLGRDSLEGGAAQLGVRLEVGQPGDELIFEGLGLGDRLGAVAAVAAGGALVAAQAAALPRVPCMRWPQRSQYRSLRRT
jgi:hypothetical protein